MDGNAQTDRSFAADAFLHPCGSSVLHELIEQRSFFGSNGTRCKSASSFGRGKREMAMQVLLGMILGVLLTVGAAFVYDSGTGRAANGLTVASAEGHAPMVNWDVVSHDLDGMKQRLRKVAADVERGWKRITGQVA